MNVFSKHFKRDRILLFGFSCALCCCIISLVALIIAYQTLPPIIPLFNQYTWGETRLGSKIEFFLPIGIAFISLIVNMFFAQRLYTKIPLLSRILALSTLVISFFVLLFILRTLQLVV